jgi:predicted ATPase
VISSIEITHFRGIREGKLDDLPPLVVLVGPNGCGKSTVLDALYIGASEQPGQAAVEAIKRHGGVERAGRWFAWRGNTAEHAQLTVATTPGNSRTCRLKFGQAHPQVLFRQPDGGRGSRRPEGFGPQMTPLEGISGIRLVEPCDFDTLPPLHRLYTDAVSQGRRDQTVEIVRELVHGATNLEILTEGDTPLLHVVFEDHSVPVAFAGDGVYSLVRLSLELASRPSGVVLLEEPEVHQHPAAIRQTVRAILVAMRRHIQVMLTTHSLELIDMLLAEATNDDLAGLSVYRLQLENGILGHRQIPGREVAFLRTEIENDLR